jgi:hypothetical protein
MFAVDGKRDGIASAHPPLNIPQQFAGFSECQEVTFFGSSNARPPRSTAAGPGGDSGKVHFGFGRRIQRPDCAGGIVTTDLPEATPSRPADLVFRFALEEATCPFLDRLVEEFRLRAVGRTIPIRRTRQTGVGECAFRARLRAGSNPRPAFASSPSAQFCFAYRAGQELTRRAIGT